MIKTNWVMDKLLPYFKHIDSFLAYFKGYLFKEFTNENQSTFWYFGRNKNNLLLFTSLIQLIYSNV